MKKFIPFGKIRRYSDVCHAIKKRATFSGFNEEGERTYNNSKLPIITATASEKIHGTNVCVSCNANEIWLQSRNNIIDSVLGHMGCGVFFKETKEIWRNMANNLAIEYNIDLTKYIISIFFEWCGGDVQKNSAVSGLQKRAIIFQHFKVSPFVEENEEDAIWFETKINNFWISDSGANVFNVMNFKTWEIEIDFNKPFEAQNKMVKIVEEIEPNSPVGQFFEKEGNIGEGIVVTFSYKDNIYKFKVKGRKHSLTKVRALNKVDEETENKMITFANRVCTPSRLEQFWNEIFTDIEPNANKTGDFLKAIFKDIAEEESSEILKENLDIKKTNKYIAKTAKLWFFEQLSNNIIRF